MLNSSAVFCSFVKPWRDWTGKTEKQLLLVNIFFTNRKIYLATNWNYRNPTGKTISIHLAGKIRLICHLYSSNTYWRNHEPMIRTEYVHNSHYENPPQSNETPHFENLSLNIYHILWYIKMLLSFARFPPRRRRPSGLCAEKSACARS